jgi:hypothetical protein
MINNKNNQPRGRNFIIQDEVYKCLRIIAAKENTTLGGAVALLLNSYDKTVNFPIKKFGKQGDK